MKILYLSCHVVLEFDELRLLHQLGHEVTSIGGYINPKVPHVDTRPALMIDSNKELENKIYRLFEYNKNKGIALENCSNTLTKEVVDDYDCVIIMHRIDWVEKNWEVIKHKPVILRTIGQNLSSEESVIKKYIDKGLKVLRYSPKERELRNYAGEHGLIRFLKYKSDFKKRNLTKNYVITFGQSITERGQWCGSSVIESVAKNVPFKLFGPGNQSYHFNHGKISYDQQLEEYATNSCYLYTGTFPAQYTLNFIEALFSGIPVVSIGKKLSQTFVEPYPFEVPFILDEMDGFYFDNVEDIISKFKELMNDKVLNNKISEKQIELATNLFSAEKNINQWNDFLKNI